MLVKKNFISLSIIKNKQTEIMTQIFAIQDNSNNYFIKNFNGGGIKIPQFGNNDSIQIFNSAQDAQIVADTLTIPVTVQQIVKKS